MALLLLPAGLAPAALAPVSLAHAPFYDGWIEQQPMVRRFTPPPTARTNARWRFLVLRTSHLHPMARRFALSPYAGAYAPRHRPSIPPETSPFVSGNPTTALHASKAVLPLRDPICAVMQLRTDRFFLGLTRVCRHQRRPCSGMFANQAHRYQSRVRSTPRPRRDPPLVQFLFAQCSLLVLSPRSLYPLTKRHIAKSAMHTSAVNWRSRLADPGGYRSRDGCVRDLDRHEGERKRFES